MLKLREMGLESKAGRESFFSALERRVPKRLIQEVLEETGVRTERERKLTLELTVVWAIVMNLLTDRPLAGIFEAMAQGIEWIGAGLLERLPGGPALVYRRYQLGARPMAVLFRRGCRPLAPPKTAGAFRFGLRLMAIDSPLEEIADTPKNAAVFGRLRSDRGAAAFPQVRCVYLCECGTHAIVDAGFWPCRTGERVGAFRLLRSVEPGMLVLWDRGFHDYELFRAAQSRGAHVLARLPANVRTPDRQPLSDGSYLTFLSPADPARRRAGERVPVRVIEYPLTDSKRTGYKEIPRLVTTLLDPEIAPALELVLVYPERWEIEGIIDELDAHQRLPGRPLRSKKPVGVIQELYGLLIAHYLVRSLIHEAALAADLDPDRLSFTVALRAFRDVLPSLVLVDPSALPCLYERLLRRIAQGRLPERRNRVQPRVVKRKMSRYYLKRPEHCHWPGLSTPFHEAVALI